MSQRACLAICLFVAFVTSRLSGQEAAESQPAAKPPAHAVKKGPFKIEVTLGGVFEAQEMTPIMLRLEEWSSLSVVDGVEHGAQVKQGDVLVSLDMEQIDAAVGDLESSQKLSELSIQQSQEELRVLEASLPADLAAAERANHIAQEDLKRFLERSRSLSEKSAQYTLKWATDYLEYQQEELRQLEKMYQADDLTEETEEIILKRARNDVDQATFYLEQARFMSEESLQIDLPRQEVAMKEDAARQALEFDKAKVAIPVALGKAKLGLETLLHDHQKAADRLAKLKKDREAMAVKAPTDGILYYGQCVRGKWSSTLGSEGKLPPGTTLPVNSVFFTIVKPRPIFVRASATEKEIQYVEVGVGGRAVPAAFPDLKLAAKVEAVAAVPTADGSFDTRIALDAGQDAQAVLPGMTSTVTLVGYSKSDAVTIPPAALFSDELDAQKQFVFRVGADGSHQKAEVTVGKRTDDKVEILQGLLEGDTVLLENPEKK